MPAIIFGCITVMLMTYSKGWKNIPIVGRGGGEISLADRLKFSVENEKGTLQKFKDGLIDLDFFDPWGDESMKDVVAGGGPLAPFVKEQDAKIDSLFGEDVRTEDMTKEYLGELLERAVKNGKMDERDMLFYMIRFQYGDDAEGFYNLLEENPDVEELRKLRIGGNTNPLGNTGLSKGAVALGQKKQSEAMRVMARQAKRQGWG